MKKLLLLIVFAAGLAGAQTYRTERDPFGNGWTTYDNQGNSWRSERDPFGNGWSTYDNRGNSWRTERDPFGNGYTTYGPQ